MDSLEEDGYEGVGVNVAERSSDRDRYHNLRAEIWSEFRELLNPDGDAIALPPDDEQFRSRAKMKCVRD